MKAVIMAGGFGHRLRPFTFSIPKPLLPVGEKPILQIILEQLRAAEICDVCLTTGYQAELIQAFCGDGSKFGLSIRYVNETEPLGTAGSLSLLRDWIGEGEYFLMMNGDILTRLDFANFMRAVHQKDCDLVVGFVKHVYRSPFGVLNVEDGYVRGIVEKPTHEYLISAGIYGVKSSALESIPQNKFFTMPELIQSLIAAERCVGAIHITDDWIGLESMTHFEEALKILNNTDPSLGSR